MINLAVALLIWSIRMGSATAAPSTMSAPTRDVDVTKMLPDGSVGVLFDPEQRDQQRNPHSIRNGDGGFFVDVSPSGRVSVARVLIRVSYSDYGRSAVYDIDPPADAKSLALTNRDVDAKTSQRVLSNARGRDLAQLGRACWSVTVSVNNPHVGVLPAQPLHAPIQIGAKPDAVVFRDGAHSLELQCDASANGLEADIAALLGELKLAW